MVRGSSLNVTYPPPTPPPSGARQQEHHPEAEHRFAFLCALPDVLVHPYQQRTYGDS
jgi:hypothetical protein